MTLLGGFPLSVLSKRTDFATFFPPFRLQTKAPFFFFPGSWRPSSFFFRDQLTDDLPFFFLWSSFRATRKADFFSLSNGRCYWLDLGGGPFLLCPGTKNA